MLSETDISPLKTLPKEKTVDVGIPLHPLRKTGSRPIQGPLSTIKGKIKVEPDDGVRQILDSFEDEMTCPMWVVSSHASIHRTEGSLQDVVIFCMFRKRDNSLVISNIFSVAAHIGTCGHSFCGECGWQWISQNVSAILAKGDNL
jgi:hypothetical protein